MRPSVIVIRPTDNWVTIPVSVSCAHPTGTPVLELSASGENSEQSECSRRVALPDGGFLYGPNAWKPANATFKFKSCRGKTLGYGFPQGSVGGCVFGCGRIAIRNCAGRILGYAAETVAGCGETPCAPSAKANPVKANYVGLDACGGYIFEVDARLRALGERLSGTLTVCGASTKIEMQFVNTARIGKVRKSFTTGFAQYRISQRGSVPTYAGEVGTAPPNCAVPNGWVAMRDCVSGEISGFAPLKPQGEFRKPFRQTCFGCETVYLRA